MDGTLCPCRRGAHRNAGRALTGDDGPKVEEQIALDAVTRLEESLGIPLTATQHEVAIGLMASGHRFDLVMGVAGSGKTTTLAAVREGCESAGYSVLGTATSGQAARNLGEGAGIESRHGRLARLATGAQHLAALRPPRADPR